MPKAAAQRNADVKMLHDPFCWEGLLNWLTSDLIGVTKPDPMALEFHAKNYCKQLSGPPALYNINNIIIYTYIYISISVANK